MTSKTILVVEDEPSVTKLYIQFLEPEYTVLTAETAQEGIDVLLGHDETTDAAAAEIDAVLLDRRLPDAPGEEVLDLIEERGFDCRVAMVTGVEPDFDIVDMGFDLGGLLREAASLASKRALLESQKSEAELEASEEYSALLDRMSELDDELLDLAGSLSSDDYRVMFRDLGNA